MRPTLRPAYGSVLVLSGVFLLGACSAATPEPSAAASTPTTDAAATGTTYEIVPDAAVTSGIATVRADAATIRATLASDQAAAKARVRAMYDAWFTFEGTVRANEKDLYLQMEDGLAAIKAGVEQGRADKVDKGIADLEAGASGYLAKHT